MSRNQHPAHRVKTLIDALPMSTAEAKKHVATQANCSPKKVQRLYANPHEGIKPLLQLRLKSIFNLSHIDQLYQ